MLLAAGALGRFAVNAPSGLVPPLFDASRQRRYRAAPHFCLLPVSFLNRLFVSSCLRWHGLFWDGGTAGLPWALLSMPLPLGYFAPAGATKGLSPLDSPGHRQCRRSFYLALRATLFGGHLWNPKF